MKRNTSLTKYKKFENNDHFFSHVNSLLRHLYPDAEIVGTKISFNELPFKGLSFEIFSTAIYPQMHNEFKDRYPIFKKNGTHSFSELVNTGLKWIGSSGKGYMYPLDRNMFDDSELGMEQKSTFFIIVMQICMQWMITNDK